jgi:starch synthase
LASAVSDSAPLSVLFVTPECTPLIKTGGLGDVSAALPAALRSLGVDARVLLPGYPQVLAASPDATELARVAVLDYGVRLLDTQLPNGVPVVIADCPKLYAREGGPYQSDEGTDWEDNAARFGVLSKLAAILGSNESPFDWLPDVIHCNDWPAALTPVYLRHLGEPHAATVITIHNLAFQGVFERAELADLRLPAAAMGPDQLEYWGKVSFLKGALTCADAITTVSATYAREIQTEALGMGLDGVLRARFRDLYGITNGIDTAEWDPLNDPHLSSPYGPLTLDKKYPNKLALKRRVGLAGSNEKPLLGMVSRLTHQKGVDLLVGATPALIAMGAQVVVVGVGERELANALKVPQTRYHDDFVVVNEFDESLAHQVEAGSDMFLMPSRFEPCGMNQMYSQRYGTPPIANATGGLVDTIEDDSRQATDKPTGFLMGDTTAGALELAAHRAVTAWKDQRRWRSIQLNGMAKDFGWEASAKKYVEVYRKIQSGK